MPLLVVVGPARWVGRVFGLLQPFLELPVEQAALLGLRGHPLAEALFAIGGPREQLVEGVAQALALALTGWRLMRDDRAQLAVQGQRGLTARAGDGEGLARHDRIVPELRQRAGVASYNRDRPWPIWRTSSPGRGAATGPFTTAAGATSISIT